MSFMQPFTYFGAYYHVDTNAGSFIVPADVVGSSADADELAQYMPEGVGMMGPDDRENWTVELRQGWYGRMSAPGYMDCTDWESADSEEELLESLTEGYDDDEEPDDDEEDSADEEPACDVPNLDGMTIDPAELRRWATMGSLATNIPADFRVMIRRYAAIKADAMDARLSGDIPAALRLESECDRIYQALPDQYRW